MEAKKKVKSKKPIDKKQFENTICGAMAVVGFSPHSKNQPGSQVYRS